jgi:uncharacterized protein (TIGR00299 family) protein
MVLGALLDAMGSLDREAALESLRAAFRRPGFRVTAETVSRGSFRAFHVDTSGSRLPTKKLATEVARAARSLGLGPLATQFAREVVDTLIQAEAKVHGRPASRVHLHELASLDTAFDATAVAFALERGGHFDGHRAVYSRPVEVGSGTVTFSHGTTPVPPPASMHLLKENRIPFTQEAGGEVATPTGLAVLAVLGPRFHPPPASIVEATGVGAGTKELPDRPNLLTVQVRTPIGPGRARPVHDPVAQIEVSLDDVGGEAAAHALSRALDEGALEAHIVQTVTKKGRPGQLLLVLAREAEADRLADVLAIETGSWGVRIAHRVARFKAVPRVERVRIRVAGKRHEVRVKLLVEDGRLRRAKAEHDDAARVARASGVPLSEVVRAAEDAAARKVKRGGPKK